MNIDKLLIIPDRTDLTGYCELADKYELGFEYNDFFAPAVLSDEDRLAEIQNIYLGCHELPDYCTSHGAFLDVTVFSDDPLIREASDLRVNQSLEIAEKVGAKGVIFHTNYIANFKLDSYREGFVRRNTEYWSRKLKEHKNLNIYIENMFDDDPELLAGLAAGLADNENFGVCFDYAHAHVFGNPEDIDRWVKSLAPYVKHIHINDNDFCQDMHLAVGDGKIDWKRFKAYYEEYFSRASVLIEVNGLDKIRRSLEFLREL